MGAERVEIGNCIIAGMAEGGTCLEQMASIVERLKLAGFVIVPRDPTVDMLVAAQEDWMWVRAAEERGSFIWDAMIRAALAA